MINKDTLKNTLVNFPFNFDEMIVNHALEKVENSANAVSIINGWLTSIDSRRRGGEDLKNLFDEAENKAYAFRRDLHDNKEQYDSTAFLSLESTGVELIRFCSRLSIVFYSK